MIIGWDLEYYPVRMAAAQKAAFPESKHDTAWCKQLIRVRGVTRSIINLWGISKLVYQLKKKRKIKCVIFPTLKLGKNITIFEQRCPFFLDKLKLDLLVLYFLNIYFYSCLSPKLKKKIKKCTSICCCFCLNWHLPAKAAISEAVFGNADFNPEAAKQKSLLFFSLRRHPGTN